VLKWRKRRRLPPTHVTGIDYAESMLAGAVHRFAGRSDVTFRHADAAALPFPTNSFDTANIANSLHCLPNVDAALKDICRVMKPGGTFAANVLLYPRGGWPLKNIAQWIDDWGVRKGILYTPYEQADIRARIVAAGFDVVAEEVSGNCYNVMMRKPA
jgi:ubiquinone/menaquinone biosynthesis C-methylase UbiE